MNIVKELCFSAGMQQKQLAIMVGVSQPTVSDWFNQKKDPSGERLKKLAEIFGVSRAVILGYENAKKETSELIETATRHADRPMNRFKKCRESAGLTQRYVATTLNVAPPSVSNWENGKSNPTNDKLEMLADLYGVSTDYLTGLSDDDGSNDSNITSFQPDFLTEEERMLVDAYRIASAEEKFKLIHLLMNIRENAQKKDKAGNNA